MTKGQFIAILIHCAGVAVAMAIVLAVVKFMSGTIADDVLTGATVFYLGTVAWVTVRVLRGHDARANAAAALIDRE